MKKIHNYLAQKQAKFTQHQFFDKIANDSDLHKLRSIGKRLSFWIMSFQDLLRLNYMRVSTPALRKVAQHHLMEDAGHDQWFLNDLKQINSEEPSLRLLYSIEYAATRDATYAVMSEVFQVRNDYERIVLLLTLESVGHVFFEHIGNFADRIGYSDLLEYFSNHHLKVEKNHELFEQSLKAYLDSIEITLDNEKNICEMIDRIYEAFTVMFDDLARHRTSSWEKALEMSN